MSQSKFRLFIRNLNLKRLPRVEVGNVSPHITLSRSIHPEKITLFSIFRDEMYFAQAFFDYHRKIGVEQFLILDDHSSDGTTEFLNDQTDCIVAKSDLYFRDRVLSKRLNGHLKSSRAGIYFKQSIPYNILKNQYSIYLDADEFLILPPDVKNIKDVLKRCMAENVRAVAAPMVEFFPKEPDDLQVPIVVNNLNDLIASYGNFEGEPLITITPSGKITEVGLSKTEKLFRKHLKAKNDKNRSKNKKQTQDNVRIYSGSTLKTPILLSSASSYRISSHKTNQPASDTIMLTIAHFVFTSNSVAKINRAKKWRSHAANGKYEMYRQLLDKMSETHASFCDEKTVSYESPQSFVQHGLMRW